jgi:hypothetical protein
MEFLEAQAAYECRLYSYSNKCTQKELEHRHKTVFDTLLKEYQQVSNTVRDVQQKEPTIDNASIAAKVREELNK